LPTDSSDSTEYVRSLERGLAVISSFSNGARRMTLSEVAERTRLNPATARRLLHTLVKLGFMREEDRYFSPTPLVLTLGHSYLASINIWDLAQPIMELLVDQAAEVEGMTVLGSSICVLEGADIVYVARLPVKRLLSRTVTIGSRVPAFATSTGRVLLSGLSEPELDEFFRRYPPSRHTEMTTTDVSQLKAILAQVRQQGWALTDQETEYGVRSIGAPIHDGSGRVAAALALATQANQVPVERIRTELLPLVMAAARQISDRRPFGD
jgi:IclR family pca regulon transcriptional regulator